MDMPPIPDRMKRFPLWRGRFPIHFTVYVSKSGEPDFKVVHEANRRQALAKNLCHLCGQRMEAPYAFIGGPLCHRNRLFVDGPMHEECARYATKACPYLALTTFDHTDRAPRVDSDHAIITHADSVAGRPGRMALMFTDRYQTLPDGKIAAGPWLSVDWTAMPSKTEPAFRSEYQQSPPDFACPPHLIGEPGAGNYAARGGGQS